jgi:hypothetical protein
MATHVYLPDLDPVSVHCLPNAGRELIKLYAKKLRGKVILSTAKTRHAEEQRAHCARSSTAISFRQSIPVPVAPAVRMTLDVGTSVISPLRIEARANIIVVAPVMTLVGFVGFTAYRARCTVPLIMVCGEISPGDEGVNNFAQRPRREQKCARGRWSELDSCRVWRSSSADAWRDRLIVVIFIIYRGRPPKEGAWRSGRRTAFSAPLGMMLSGICLVTCLSSKICSNVRLMTS